jgi:signal transduction histidine kinase
MRERVELIGGSLSAGPAPDGGFAVSAVLPLGGSA